MTIEEMQNGYKKEVAYQKHMLRNLGYWFQLFLTTSAIGLVLIYYFYKSTLLLFVIGIVLMIVGVLGMLIFGYASWRGRKNVSLVIKDYENKIAEIKKINRNAGGTAKIKYR
ncbi:hypothetical protein [Lactobacillus ultunensis]|uniref:PTS fructose transporter subunit IA n=1 Tax=Lactobacillus ultunensis DSM 16047 TaxID=525365 RepID=C2ER76_9LACO|nr:hypothetical protein [Lactobacillus ultunensis]EEJ70965.1 hypothetical protein HMPREF0548_2172 [Lactobacillus ultunensis DSM 16047]KRL80869.1 hypothetical protein FC57_GL001012 [Lactobacillus ultunensis DSM 16047]QQP28987.1 DUF202 domain-containing protein [Lactobacillus ultunensis]